MCIFGSIKNESAFKSPQNLCGPALHILQRNILASLTDDTSTLKAAFLTDVTCQLNSLNSVSGGKNNAGDAE